MSGIDNTAAMARARFYAETARIPDPEGNIHLTHPFRFLEPSLRRMVHDDRAGSGRHQLLAQRVQSHTTTSGARNAPSSARNSTAKWPMKWGWTP